MYTTFIYIYTNTFYTNIHFKYKYIKIHFMYTTFIVMIVRSESVLILILYSHTSSGIYMKINIAKYYIS